ncbi:unnamed protein product [Schistocephalus solidus]|uniref:Uncharacterized protein n=1 Tax=Schistocephalus solidus TaxID=70667 RepID=A0A3P7BQI3_SCHSO|nr:unnamed protein product [Schistocephalus solidus]
MHTPTVEKVPVSSVGDADPREFIIAGVHQQSREPETEEDGGQFSALFHCEYFRYHPIVSHARHDPFLMLSDHVGEPLRTAEFPHDFPESVAIPSIKGFLHIHEGCVEVGSPLLALLL